MRIMSIGKRFMNDWIYTIIIMVMKVDIKNKMKLNNVKHIEMV